MKQMHRYLVLFSIILLASCGSISEIDIIDDITAPDYVSSSRARKLEIPPDLSQLETQDEYEVPGEATSYKNYKDKNNPKIKKEIKVVQDPAGIKIVKSGNLRWLVVEKDPDSLWPHVQNFWEEDMGVRVKVANKRTGVIETEWFSTAELSNESGNKLDRWLDSMSQFADKRKFRTRLELGTKNDTTEIFLSHRSSFSGMDQHKRIKSERGADFSDAESIYSIQEYVSDEEGGQSERVKSEQMKVDDYEINSEILRRLMIKLGATDFDAKEKIQRPQEIIKAELINTEQGRFIQMNDPYDRAWRRLSLALDIIGFITEDRDRSKGIFYVKYKDIELPKIEEQNKDKGLIDSLLFWKDDEQEKKEPLPSSPGVILDKDKPEKGTDNNLPKETTADDDILFSDKTLQERFPILNLWGSDDEKKPDDEFRYRIRISPIGDLTKVYLDFPDGSVNNTQESQQIIKIIFEQLK